MKKIICKREYNTETANRIHSYTQGAFGDPAGFEETLYQTPSGLYFLYFNGGCDSAYPQENIKSISKVKAEAWLREHA